MLNKRFVWRLRQRDMDKNRRHKYVRKQHHTKKVKDQAREDWRDHKGFIRDLRKSRWERSCPAWQRVQNNRQERTYNKQELYRAEWDRHIPDKCGKFLKVWWN